MIFLVLNVWTKVECRNKYCSLCPNHIACNNYGAFASICPQDAVIATLGLHDTNVLLSEHNNFRNKLAGGSLANFSAASKMMKMVSNL